MRSAGLVVAETLTVTPAVGAAARQIVLQEAEVVATTHAHSKFYQGAGAAAKRRYIHTLLAGKGA